MKIVCFSDVHGNYDSVKSMVQKEKNADAYIFCGDIVGYYFEEKKVVQLFKTLKNLYAVKGNHDSYYQKIAMGADALYKEELVEKYGPCYQQIDAEVLQYIETMPTFLEIKIQNKNIFVCHGTLNDNLEGRMYPSDDAISDNDADIIIFGHTHYSMLKQNNNIWVNPGSIGQPRDGNGFSYGVIQIINDVVETEIRTIDFDVKAFANKIKKYYKEDEYAYKVLLRRNC